MTFKTISELLDAINPIREAVIDSAGLGQKTHPVFSRAEVVRFLDKLDQARNKLIEIETIFKEVPDASGPAHKLHHFGIKGSFDMGHFTDVNAAVAAVGAAIDDLHQSWGTQLQQETGAFDDETPNEKLPAEEPAPAK